jgi:hypothetical protein
MKSIVLIVDYFGKWVPYFDLWLISCAHNPTINWIVNTDCPIPNNCPKNVKFNQISFDQFKRNVSDKLGISFNPTYPYKLVDIQPAYGVLHEDIIKGYDYYGHTDIDLLYGELRSFFTDQILTCDVITTRSHLLAGHFTLFRNVDHIRYAYTKIDCWKRLFEDDRVLMVDELFFAVVFNKDALYIPDKPVTQPDIDLVKILFPQGVWNDDGVKIFPNTIPTYCDNNSFVEYYTTPFGGGEFWYDGSPSENHPDTFIWDNGIVIDLNGYKYPYIHVMNFEKKRSISRMYDPEKNIWTSYFDHVQSWNEAVGKVKFETDMGPNNSVTVSWDGIIHR